MNNFFNLRNYELIFTFVIIFIYLSLFGIAIDSFPQANKNLVKTNVKFDQNAEEYLL